MASPAEVANDMAARAKFWRGRDTRLQNVCHDAALVIRRFLAGERVHGSTCRGLHDRLLRYEGMLARWSDHSGTGEALGRARRTLDALWREARA